jgi:hypothetical protein
LAGWQPADQQWRGFILSGSKKRSDANSTSTPLESVVFFIDRDLGLDGLLITHAVDRNHLNVMILAEYHSILVERSNYDAG